MDSSSSSLLIYLLITLSALFNTNLNAQVSKKGVPSSYRFNYNQDNITNIKIKDFTSAEVQSLRSQKSKDCSECKNSTFGKGIKVNIDITKNQYSFIDSNNNKIWLFEIKSDSAFGYQLFFSKFQVPKEGKLYIYSKDRSFILGYFDSDNRKFSSKNNIEFGIQAIPSNKIVIEYSVPKNIDPGTLIVSDVVYIFDPIFKSGPFGQSGNCNINVKCPLGNGWEKEANSIGLITYYNNQSLLSSLCTGALINNTEEDGRPLFLTARHCIEDPTLDLNPNLWHIIFNHRTQLCSSDGSELYTWSGNSINGATILTSDLQGSPKNDALLLELHASKITLVDYELCLSGWSKNESQPNNKYTIHHPSGDVQKISMGNSTLNGNYYDVQWQNGTTEGGSSGAPLFNNNHKIIGQLRGGPASCNNNGIDRFGTMFKSWEYHSFGFYLDPYLKNLNEVATYCPYKDANVTHNQSFSVGSNCAVKGGIGFKINNIGYETPKPCVSLPIVLSPNQDYCYPEWTYIPITETFNCNDKPKEFENTECWQLLVQFWKCRCIYFRYFIEIANVDNNGNFIGSPVSKWVYLPITGLGYSDSPDYSNGANPTIYIKRVTLENTFFEELGIKLLSGNNYRIKLVFHDSKWVEDVRIFKFLEEDVIITDASNSVSAVNTLTIQNCVLDNNHSFTAGKKILLHETSKLKSGKYYIKETTCH